MSFPLLFANNINREVTRRIHSQYATNFAWNGLLSSLKHPDICCKVNWAYKSELATKWPFARFICLSIKLVTSVFSTVPKQQRGGCEWEPTSWRSAALKIPMPNECRNASLNAAYMCCVEAFRSDRIYSLPEIPQQSTFGVGSSAALRNSSWPDMSIKLCALH